ncbi:hypothetical protein P692DRAFT_20159006 [Suillus brevipes Sb2]|nr:hypothetical protein P692DRAFT_20159006 [Suillus brevipes Sb2]
MSSSRLNRPLKRALISIRSACFECVLAHDHDSFLAPVSMQDRFLINEVANRPQPKDSRVPYAFQIPRCAPSSYNPTPRATPLSHRPHVIMQVAKAAHYAQEPPTPPVEQRTYPVAKMITSS